MIKVRLYAEFEGQLIDENKFVVAGYIPPFLELPKVILWGSRVFEYVTFNEEKIGIYKECFSVYLVNTDPLEG